MTRSAAPRGSSPLMPLDPPGADGGSARTRPIHSSTTASAPGPAPSTPSTLSATPASSHTRRACATTEDRAADSRRTSASRSSTTTSSSARPRAAAARPNRPRRRRPPWAREASAPPVEAWETQRVAGAPSPATPRATSSRRAARGSVRRAWPALSRRRPASSWASTASARRFRSERSPGHRLRSVRRMRPAARWRPASRESQSRSSTTEDAGSRPSWGPASGTTKKGDSARPSPSRRVTRSRRTTDRILAGTRLRTTAIGVLRRAASSRVDHGVWSP